MKIFVLFSILTIFSFSSYSVEERSIYGHFHSQSITHSSFVLSEFLIRSEIKEADFKNFEPIEELKNIIDTCFIKCNDQLFKNY